MAQHAAAEEEIAPFLAATIGSTGSLNAVYLLSARAHLRMAQGRPAEAIADLACGAIALARTARDELVGSGARLRRLPTTGAASLTPTERRVAETVAGGLTNRAAAQALFVSEKTIEAHLRHAYAKLGISSRSQLRRALDERC